MTHLITFENGVGWVQYCSREPIPPDEMDIDIRPRNSDCPSCRMLQALLNPRIGPGVYRFNR